MIVEELSLISCGVTCGVLLVRLLTKKKATRPIAAIPAVNETTIDASVTDEDEFMDLLSTFAYEVIVDSVLDSGVGGMVDSGPGSGVDDVVGAELDSEVGGVLDLLIGSGVGGLVGSVLGGAGVSGIVDSGLDSRVGAIVGSVLDSRVGGIVGSVLDSGGPGVSPSPPVLPPPQTQQAFMAVSSSFSKVQPKIWQLIP